MGYLERIAQTPEVSRRSFVKGGVAATALAIAGLSGCQGNVTPDPEPAVEPTPTVLRDLTTGEWKGAACWHNCGGRCANRVLVRDGIVIRQKTDDISPDTEAEPQQRACVRGRAQRIQCFGADRLKYPMKRKNWSPENPHGELRGKDEWERITWDEAIAYVTSELKKVYDAYGPKGVLGFGSDGVSIALKAMGGYVVSTDTASFGTYSCGVPTKLGLGLWDWSETANDRYDLKKSDWIILQSTNPAWVNPGLPIYSLLQAKKAGAQFVCIAPDYNATAQMVNARWIPVRPGGDTAFMMGVAYAMLELEDTKGNIIDWDFLHKYCVGFDDESMPTDAATEENILGYLLGEYDDTPKTPEWASAISGATAEDIRWYAETIQKNNKVAMLHSYGMARCVGAEDVAQMFMTLGCMGGHFGKAGHCCGSSTSQTGFNDGPSLVSSGAAGLNGASGTIYEPVPAPILWSSIEKGSYHYVGTFYGTLDKGEDRPLNIHAVVFEYSAALQTTPHLMKGVEVLRKMDFVMASAYVLTTQAKYSDVVLPCTTQWERPGGFSGANRETLIAYQQIMEPLYEAKSDQEIGELMLAAWGIDSKPIFNVSEKQQFMNKILGCTYLKPDGSSAPLVTVTSKDLSSWGCEGTPQTGVIGVDELLSRGFYHVKREEGDGYDFIAYKSFIDDPVANPRPTASGKFEIYCQAKADEFNAPGISPVIKPYPTYFKPARGYETLSAEYPYLCFNPHYLRRSHSVFDNVTWLRETWPNPVYIAAKDAAAKGIKSGDAVCITSAYGKVVRTASVLESLIPGVIGLPHGAWINMDDKEQYDMAGADNALIGPELSTSAVSGYNNINVNFEKYTGSVTADCEWPQRIPIKD